MLTILSLCDYTGSWSKPYRDAGYNVVQVDIKHGHDVRLFEARSCSVRGVLAAPPCTHFASSGARWWKDKGDYAVLDGLSVVDACMRIIAVHRPQWWALENPVGRLKNYLGQPTMSFNPCDYGDPYTKRTLLWGNFTPPPKRPVEPTEGSKMNEICDGPKRGLLRSVTPDGFAQAFFLSNP
jgi:hypothetical protein